MTGLEIYRRALALLGYWDEVGNPMTGGIGEVRAAELINQLLSDLNGGGIGSLSDEISLDNKDCDALCCGTAMLIALAEGDSAKNSLFTELYNAKRAAAKSRREMIGDVLPSVSAE